MTRRARRTIRGCVGDRVVLTVTLDPLDEALGLPPIPLLHLSVTDACGDSCTTDGDGRNANVVGIFTLAGAIRMRDALNALLATKSKRRKTKQ